MFTSPRVHKLGIEAPGGTYNKDDIRYGSPAFLLGNHLVGLQGLKPLIKKAPAHRAGTKRTHISPKRG